MPHPYFPVQTTEPFVFDPTKLFRSSLIFNVIAQTGDKSKERVLLKNNPKQYQSSVSRVLEFSTSLRKVLVLQV